ncbi:MAG TPA: hypothetical protein VNO70_19930 [Blastocatellia bacterium]|nr:hypothetical protein [Blastocatellia bacterium]
MKKHFLPSLTFFALAIFLISLTAPAGAASPQPAQSKEFRKTVDFEAGGELSLRTDKGSVRMTSWDRNQVEIIARIEPPENVSEEYGRQAVEATKVDVLGDARALTIRSNFDDVPYKDTFNRSRMIPNVHYEIRAPRRLNFNLDIDRSGVDLSGFEGRMNLKTDRTTMKAGDMAGELRLNMDRGELTLSGYRGRFEIDTDRTDSRLQGVQIDGDSRFEMDRGELELRMPESQGLTLSAAFSRLRDFHSDFGIASRTLSRDRIEGTINGGGPKLLLRAQRSGVSLKRQ